MSALKAHIVGIVLTVETDEDGNDKRSVQLRTFDNDNLHFDPDTLERAMRAIRSVQEAWEMGDVP